MRGCFSAANVVLVGLGAVVHAVVEKTSVELILAADDLGNVFRELSGKMT